MAEFFWFNRFNGVERDGPFPTIQKAKNHVVRVMKAIQHGFAFDIVISDGRRIVENGYIKKGKWIAGDYKPKKGEPGYSIFGEGGDATA